MSNQYELALRVPPAERKTPYIQHHVIERDEEYLPKYSVDVLIDEYVQTFTEEEQQKVMTNEMVMSIAIENVITMAKESFEYGPIWEARVVEDYATADRLMVDLQSYIRTRLKNADAVKIDIFDMDDPEGKLFDSFMDGMDGFDENDRLMYETLAYQKKQRIDGMTFDALEGQGMGYELFDRWLTEPAKVEKELRLYEKELRDIEAGIVEDTGAGRDFRKTCLETFQRMLLNHNSDEVVTAPLPEETTETTQLEGGESLQADVQAQRRQETPEESAERKAQIHQNVTKQKEEEKVSGTQSNYSKPTSGFSSNHGFRSSTTTTKEKKAEHLEGMFDYDSLPDGDQFEEPVAQQALPDGVYQAMDFPEEEIKPKSRVERMKQVRKENPKLGKNAGESMQKGIALGRVYTLPEREDIKRARTSFRKRPFHFLKTKVRELYHAHRKAANVMIKMTAFVAVQLGVNVLAGRMEVKEDRHFVQMIVLTMTSFYLTQSLNKDGMPVGNAAFIM